MVWVRAKVHLGEVTKVSPKVIELIRVSTEGQAAEGRAGIPAQRAANWRTAAQYGLEIIRTIELADVSGAAVLRTPEMQELLRLMESPEIHGVVTRDFSRLMRPENFADYALLQAFADTGTLLYLPEGPIDLRSKSGRLLGTIRAAIAGLERTEILERIWAAKEEKRRAGKHPQGQITLPYGIGYDSKEQSWHYKPEVEKVREAFRLFLSGETGYTEVGRKLGMDPFSLRIILRNPIYTGWRVYSQRRDPSPLALRVRANGRQADRPKIPRAPEEIIRVKVMEPLVSEAEFQRVQQILDRKKQNHWRVRPEYEHRFTYNGLLRCGICENLIYTHARKSRNWYVCKSRTTAERLAREEHGLARCTNPYMRRERLEASLDELFSERLTDRNFLDQIATSYVERSSSWQGPPEILRIERERERLEVKRQRVLEAYFDNLIDRSERERRLAEIEADNKFYEDLVSRAQPSRHELSPEALAEAFAPFYEWRFLSRLQKRRFLQAIVPEIHVRDYRAVGLSLLADTLCQNEETRTGRGSLPRRA